MRKKAPDSTEEIAKLHRVHAMPSTGNSFDIGSVRWRGDGGDNDLKRAMSYRLSFCWNMAEGIPLEALEAGAVDGYYEAARQLADAAREEMNALKGGTLEKALEAFDRAEKAMNVDRTHGRLHDCEDCIEKEKTDDEDVQDG